MAMEESTGGSGGKKATKTGKGTGWDKDKEPDWIVKWRARQRAQQADTARYNKMAQYYREQRSRKERREREAAADPDMARAQHWMAQRRPVMEAVKRRPQGPYGGQMTWDQWNQHEKLTQDRYMTWLKSTAVSLQDWIDAGIVDDPYATTGTGTLRQSVEYPSYGGGGGRRSSVSYPGPTNRLQQPQQQQNMQQYKTPARWVQQVANWNIRGR